MLVERTDMLLVGIWKGPGPSSALPVYVVKASLIGLNSGAKRDATPKTQHRATISQCQLPAL
jgi:hypothetical protein